MKNICLLLITLFSFISCDSQPNEESKTGASTNELMAPPSPAAIREMEVQESEDKPSPGNFSTVGKLITVNDVTENSAYDVSSPPKKQDEPEITHGKKLIKNGSIRIQVENYAEARPKITNLIAQHKAYISSENETNSGNTLENHITIRVPYNQFDALVSKLEKEAKYVDSKSVNVEDVTAEYVDTEARLKTRRVVEARYMDFLKKAKNIEETLLIEEQIRQLREEIESAEGRLKLMRDQVMYSTLQLDVYENLPYKVSPVAENGFFAKLGEAFVKGWRVMLNVFVGIAYLWPFVLAGLLVFFLFRKRFSRMLSQK